MEKVKWPQTGRGGGTPPGENGPSCLRAIGKSC